jgi:transposase
MKKSMRHQTDKSKHIRLAADDPVHVGVDVHIEKFHVAVWSLTHDRLVDGWVMPADPEGLATALDRVAGQIERVVYEAGPTGFGLVRFLEEQGYDVDVISAAHIPREPKKKAKSDRLDCRDLARLSTKGLLRAVYVPTPQEEDDREFFRVRDQLMEKLRRAKQQIKGLLTMRGIAYPDGLKNWSLASIQCLKRMKLPAGFRFHLDRLLADLEHFTGQVRLATLKLAEVVRLERHAATVRQMRTAPGVGPLTASAFVLELYRADRFADQRAVGQMLGLAPLRRGSGETTHECGRDLQGNRRLRSLLIEAAWGWVRYDAGARIKFCKLSARKKERKIAITAMARRLGIILWRIWIEQRPYWPAPAPGA